MTSPRYLGDGAYVASTPYEVELTTSNGIAVTNRIVLGPREIDRLIDYLRDIGVQRLNPERDDEAEILLLNEADNPTLASTLPSYEELLKRRQR